MPRPKHPPLTGRQSDLAAAHVRLAARMLPGLRRHAPDQVSSDELHAHALAALVRLAASYRSDVGLSFEAYAKRFLLGKVIDCLREEARWFGRQYVRRNGYSQPGPLPFRLANKTAQAAPDLLTADEVGGPVGAAFHRLSARQRAVLTLVDVEGGSQADAAVALGLCRSRVSQIRAEALAEMRAGLKGAAGE